MTKSDKEKKQAKEIETEGTAKDDQEIKGSGRCDCADLEHKYKLALADYQNLLKQTAREKEEFHRFATEQFLQEILPVYDNLKMSFQHTDETAAANGWLKGIEYIIKQFSETLSRMGIEAIKTEGELFDYHIMEAVEKKNTEDEKKDGLVERELKSGYKLHGKVIVPARVSVWEFVAINEQ